MRATSVWLFAALLLAGPMLAGCADGFDLDKLDVFNLNKEKKLPGERKPLFPEGVPGVTQGIPPELVKGHKPSDTAAMTEEGLQQDKAAQEKPQPEPQSKPKPKPKPKPHVVHRAPKPTQQPAQAQQQQPAQTQQQPAQQQQAQQQPSIWPDPKPQQQQPPSGAQSPWPEPPKQTSPWPDAPPPNTFQR